MSQELIIKSLGVSNYLETLAFMHAHIKSDDFQDEVWMLEHPPVFTLGTAADENHVINPKDIPVIQSDRGGEVTYHGPGQLVIYLMIDIKKTKLGPKSLVRSLQEFVQSLLAEYSIESNFIKGAPGVYVNKKKINETYNRNHHFWLINRDGTPDEDTIIDLQISDVLGGD